MIKSFSSVIIVEFAYNNRIAAAKEEYIELLKEEYLARHDIELEGHEITEITEIISPHKLFFLDKAVQKIEIRCGLLSAASIHAPTSMKIVQKEKIQERSSRFLLIRALVLNIKEKDDPDEIVMIFRSSMPFLFPECNIEIEDTLAKGQNFGILAFGGKLDLLISNNFLSLRIKNQTSIAGETILAMLR